MIAKLVPDASHTDSKTVYRQCLGLCKDDGQAPEMIRVLESRRQQHLLAGETGSE